MKKLYEVIVSTTTRISGKVWKTMVTYVRFVQPFTDASRV